MTAKRVLLNARPYRGKNMTKKILHANEQKSVKQVEEWLNSRVNGTVEGITFREIAEALNLKVEWVKDLMQANFGQCNELTL
jgi:hypothetical protein